jgi:hypothetical protein
MSMRVTQLHRPLLPAHRPQTSATLSQSKAFAGKELREHHIDSRSTAQVFAMCANLLADYRANKCISGAPGYAIGTFIPQPPLWWALDPRHLPGDTWNELLGSTHEYRRLGITPVQLAEMDTTGA